MKCESKSVFICTHNGLKEGVQTYSLLYEQVNTGALSFIVSRLPDLESRKRTAYSQIEYGIVKPSERDFIMYFDVSSLPKGLGQGFRTLQYL